MFISRVEFLDMIGSVRLSRFSRRKIRRKRLRNAFIRDSHRERSPRIPHHAQFQSFPTNIGVCRARRAIQLINAFYPSSADNPSPTPQEQDENKGSANTLMRVLAFRIMHQTRTWGVSNIPRSPPLPPKPIWGAHATQLCPG